MRTIIGITGASGSILGVEFLKRCPGEKILVLSKWGKAVLAQETGLSPSDLSHYANAVFSNEDLNAPVASGSNSFDHFVVMPCSMATLSRMASGLSDNLMTRVAEVALKESRRMLLGIRETPLSAIALENALKLSRLGVTIMPLSPQFYFNPQSMDEMINRFVDHVLSTLNLPAPSGWRSEKLS